MSEDLEIPDFARSPLLRPLLSSSSRPANEDSHIRGVRHPVSSISNFPAPRDRGAEAPAPPPAKLASSRKVPAYLRGARGRDICNLASSHEALHQRGWSEGPRCPREAPTGDSLPTL